MTRDQELDCLKNVRGRRLLICRATDRLRDIVNALGEDDGSGPAWIGAPDPITPRRRADLLKMVDVLRSMLITANDGGGNG